MTLVAVIPAHNEAASIESVVSGTRPHVDQLVVVDDGSSDETPEILQHLLDRLDFQVLRHETCRGKAAALATGFAAALKAEATHILTLDGDGQHDPAAIPELRDACEYFPDHLILGARLLNRDDQPGLRRFANRLADFWVSWASGQRVPDSQTGFRIYPRSLVEKVQPSTLKKHGFVFESQMLVDGARAGHPCAGVAVQALYAPDRRASYFQPRRDIWQIFCFIFWRIALKGLYLNGLWRMARQPAPMYRPIADDDRPD